MKNQAEKGKKKNFLCFFNKGSSLILSWIFISVCTFPVLNKYQDQILDEYIEYTMKCSTPAWVPVILCGPGYQNLS